jgi:hypothetical protein
MNTNELISELRAQANQHQLDADLTFFDVAATALDRLTAERDLLLDFAREVKKQLVRNGEYAPISHIWVDSAIAGKDVNLEVNKAFGNKMERHHD